MKPVRARRGWIGKNMEVVGTGIWIAWLGLGFGACGACAQEPAPLPIEAIVDSWTFDYTTPARFSPDGRALAYTLNPSTRSDSQNVALSSDIFNQSGVYPTFAGQQIHVLDVKAGVDRDLTGGVGSNWGPSWSPDGDYLAFLSDRDETGQAKLWMWDRTTNRLRKVAEVPVRSAEVQWLPDSKRIVTVVAADHGSPGRNDAERIAEIAQNVSRSTVRIYDSLGGSAGQNAYPWDLERVYPLRDLAFIDVRSGEIRILCSRIRIAKFLVAPDGRGVVFTSPVRFEKPGSQQTLFDIRHVRVTDGQLQLVAREVRLDLSGAALSWSRDGSRIVYQTGGMEGNGDCVLFDLRTGISKALTSFGQDAPYYSVSAPLWDTGGKRIYVSRRGALWRVDAKEGGASEITKVRTLDIISLVQKTTGLIYSPDGANSVIALAREKQSGGTGFYAIGLLSGEARQLYAPGFCFSCVRASELTAVSSDGRAVAFFAGDSKDDVDLWLTDTTFEHPRPLTRINPQLAKYVMGTARLVEWLSLDGTKLKGALLLPSDYRPGKRYPLIVKVYGGQSGSLTLGVFGLERGVTNLQLLATRGYAVLFPDAPTRLGTPMADLAKTILPGINRVVEMGIADPERIGLIGHSFGGYSALALLVQTGRFKAAVESAGYGDVIASYGELAEDGSSYAAAIEEGGQGRMGGTPWEFRSRYVENSPLFYLDRIETPLLMIHGGADNAVDPFLAGEVFVGLRRLGKTVQFAKYRGEGHDMNFWSRANKIDFCERVIGWFDAHLKGDALPAYAASPVPADQR